MKQARQYYVLRAKGITFRYTLLTIFTIKTDIIQTAHASHSEAHYHNSVYLFYQVNTFLSFLAGITILDCRKAAIPPSEYDGDV